MKKNIIIRTWKRNLNERKQAFWNALKTENIVNIYKRWRQEENTIIMPRKFHIKKIAGEDETERAIRENLALQKFDAEIALLETRSTRYTQRFQNIDIKMEDEIKKISSGEVQNHLLKQWKKVTMRRKKILNTSGPRRRSFMTIMQNITGTLNWTEMKNLPKTNR